MNGLQRALLRKHGYDPDLRPRGVAGPPEKWMEEKWKLRNHVCKLEGVLIDGHSVSDLDNDGTCIYCGEYAPDDDDQVLCAMCDRPIHFSYEYDEWQHEDGEYHCPGKGSCVATYPDPEEQV